MAGRVRMPHNNRVPAGRALVTSDIWSKTIGHDPYAATENDDITESEAALHAEKTKTLLELAKHQNLGVDTRSSKDGADNFARQMFLGLKTGKKRRRTDVSSLGQEGGDDRRSVTEEMARCLEADSSSSEEEFVEEEEERATKPVGGGGRNGEKEIGDAGAKKTSVRRKKSRKKKKKSRKNRDDSSYSSSRHRRKRHRRRKEERNERRRRHDRKRRRKRDSDDDLSQSDVSDGESTVEDRSTRLCDSSKGKRKRDDGYNERKEDNVNSINKSLEEEKLVDA